MLVAYIPLPLLDGFALLVTSYSYVVRFTFAHAPKHTVHRLPRFERHSRMQSGKWLEKRFIGMRDGMMVEHILMSAFLENNIFRGIYAH